MSNTFSIASVYFCIYTRGYMKDDIVVYRILMMTMFKPVGRVGMNLNVTYPYYSVYFNFGIEKIAKFDRIRLATTLGLCYTKGAKKNLRRCT